MLIDFGNQYELVTGNVKEMWYLITDSSHPKICYSKNLRESKHFKFDQIYMIE